MMLVRAPDEITILLVRAETGVDLVEVGDRVSMVGKALLIVLNQRRRPDHREPQSFDVVEVLAHAPKVASMAAVLVGALGLLRQLWHAVIRRVAIGESVGDYQIDRVPGIEAPAQGRVLSAGFQPIRGDRGHLVVPLEDDLKGTGWRIRRDQEVDKKVIRTVGAPYI